MRKHRTKYGWESEIYGFGCSQKPPIVDAAQYSVFADTIGKCQKYSIMISWLSVPAVHLLQDTISPFVTNLQ